jgi:chemotaxis protein CheD
MSERSVYLQPGEWCLCEAPARVETVLGSCLGIVMRHREGTTCVAHCMLPEWDGAPSAAAAGKYVDQCLPEMLGVFERRGLAAEDLEVMLFGAAKVLGHRGGSDVLRIGDGNVRTAQRILQHAGVRVVAKRVGGTNGCKIVVDTRTGEVELRALGGAPRAKRTRAIPA